MVDFNEISQSITEGDTPKAVQLTKVALELGIPVKDILDKGLISGLRKTGELFSSGECFLPELIISGEAAKAALGKIKLILSKVDIPPVGKYLIGTVQGDVHDIGKNVVIMMLEGNGWEVTDLGVDVPPEQFCIAVEEGNFDILGLSALLTMTMPKQAETIKALESAGLRQRVKIMIGGVPVTQQYADEIGADAYAPNAAEAVKMAAALVEKV